MNDAILIKDYLKSLDRDGGFRETKEILEMITHQATVKFQENVEHNAFVCLNKSHFIGGVPVLQIWINGCLLECKVCDVSGDIAPHFEG